MPRPGSIQESAVLLFVSMREVRRFQIDLTKAALNASEKSQMETVKKNLLEAYGLEDKEDRDKRQSSMVEAMNRWAHQDPFTVEKMESSTDIQAKMAAKHTDARNREIRKRRTLFGQDNMPKRKPRRGI